MAYLSPFKLLPFLTIDLVSSQDFDYQILKRKILVEYELNDNQPIDIDGKYIGKTEALRVLELLKDPEVLKQHVLISRNEELLNFLENGDLYFFAFVENHEMELPELIHLDFIQKFSEQLARFYQNNQSDEVDLLTKYPINKLNSGEDPFELLYKKIKSDLITLEEIQNHALDKDKIEKLKPIIQHFTYQKAEIINLLPFNYSYLRDKIIEISINLSSDIYNNTKEKSLAHALCGFATQIKASQELVDLAKKNFNLMDISNGNTVWRITYMILMATLFLAFLFSKCSC